MGQDVLRKTTQKSTGCTDPEECRAMEAAGDLQLWQAEARGLKQHCSLTAMGGTEVDMWL